MAVSIKFWTFSRISSSMIIPFFLYSFCTIQHTPGTCWSGLHASVFFCREKT
jgi:hypothetical protein